MFSFPHLTVDAAAAKVSFAMWLKHIATLMCRRGPCSLKGTPLIQSLVCCFSDYHCGLSVPLAIPGSTYWKTKLNILQYLFCQLQ